MRIAACVAAGVAILSLTGVALAFLPTKQDTVQGAPRPPIALAGPENFQWQIDSAPAGATLHVPGRYWKPIIITKPLTLIGEEGATFYNEQELGPDPFAAPITLAGPGHGTVTLVNINVEGRVDGHHFSSIAGGVFGGGFDALELYECNVSAPWYWRWHMLCTGGPGISVAVDRVLLVRSTVVASAGKSDCCDRASASAGIDAPGSLVELSSSVVIGAPFLDPCTRDTCPDQWVMDQGAGVGIRARCLTASASWYSGGDPQSWRYFVGTGDCYLGNYFDCGLGPPSQAFVKTGHCNNVKRLR